MTYPQYNPKTGEHDQAPASGQGGIGVAREKTKAINNWLDNMTPEQWDTHLKNEADLKKRKDNDLHY